MPLSIEIEADQFVQPLEGEHPGGENLQASEEGRALRSELRGLREEARQLERKADEGDTSEGGWPAARTIWAHLRDQALDVLRTRSRDLDIAALLIEALARTDGFAGLAAGFDLTRELVSGSWHDLYPIPDPEDGPAEEPAISEERALPLQRLVGIESEGLLVPAILHVPLTEGRSGEQYGLCHWRSSRELIHEDNEEKLKLAVERGGIAPAQFEQAVAATPVSHLKTTYTELQAAAGAWEALSSAVTEVSDGAAVVPAGPIRDLFEECDNAFRTFAPAVIPQPAVESHSDDPDSTGESHTSTPGAPGDREEAFRQMSSIADYFERHDPHSLIAAQIRNVVRLGRLPRAEYYRELLRDDAALALLFRAAGMDGDAGDMPPPHDGDG